MTGTPPGTTPAKRRTPARTNLAAREEKRQGATTRSKRKLEGEDSPSNTPARSKRKMSTSEKAPTATTLGSTAQCNTKPGNDNKTERTIRTDKTVVGANGTKYKLGYKPNKQPLQQQQQIGATLQQRQKSRGERSSSQLNE